LKEGGAPLTPSLPRLGLLLVDGGEEDAGQGLGIEGVGPGCGHQLA
jgi:hypothetical protein